MNKFSTLIKIALVGLLGALLLVSVLSRQDITIYAFDFTLSLQIFDRGYTVIDIPPLGTIRARTHQLPLMFRISLKNINLQRLSTLVTEGDFMFDDIIVYLRRQVVNFLLRLLGLAFVGGFGAGYIFFRDTKRSLAAGVAGLLVFSLLLGTAALTYNEDAFRAPEFEGVIEAAPWLMGVADEALAAVEDLDAKMQIVTHNLFRLFQSLQFFGPAGGVDGDIKVLHISDIHNNPISHALVVQMVEAFNVDLIIDTGDITDYGTPLETQLVEEIGQLQIPYIFVAGNHDSPAVIARMGMLENVIVLDGVIHLEELDLVVAGAHDPASQDSAMAVRPKSEYLEAAQNLREKIDQFGRKPDIIAFHHVFMAEVFIDLPTVLLHGHSHRVNVRRQGEAVVVDSGTTGGAGVRGLMTREELPYSMVLLHFSRTEEGIRLLAADIIKVYNINSGFILERRLFSDGGEITGPQDTLPGEDPQTGDDED